MKAKLPYTRFFLKNRGDLALVILNHYKDQKPRPNWKSDSVEDNFDAMKIGRNITFFLSSKEALQLIEALVDWDDVFKSPERFTTVFDFYTRMCSSDIMPLVEVVLKHKRSEMLLIHLIEYKINLYKRQWLDAEQMLLDELLVRALDNPDVLQNPKLIIQAFYAVANEHSTPDQRTRYLALIEQASRSFIVTKPFLKELESLFTENEPALPGLMDFACKRIQHITDDDKKFLKHALDLLPETSESLQNALSVARQSGLDFSLVLLRDVIAKGYVGIMMDIVRHQMAIGRSHDIIKEIEKDAPREKKAQMLKEVKAWMLTLPAVQRIAAEHKGRLSDDYNRYIDLMTPKEKLAFTFQCGMWERLDEILSPLTVSEQLQLIFKAKEFAPKINIYIAMLFKIDESLLQRPVPEVKLPVAPTDINIDELLTMFDAINFDEPSEPGYVSPQKLAGFIKRMAEASEFSKKGLRDALQTYITRVHNRVAYTGTPSADKPKELEAFYQKAENALRVAIMLLREEEEQLFLKSTLVLDLAVAGTFCGGRYITEPTEVYKALKFDPGAANLDGLSLIIAQRLRTGIISHMANEFAAYVGNIPHVENYLLTELSKLRGVPLPEFEDTLATKDTVKVDLRDKILETFDEYHTDEALIAHFESFNELKREMKDLVIDWFSEQVPDWFEQEKYEPILKSLESMPKEQVLDYLLDQDISFSWTGLVPQDALVQAKQVLTSELRTRLNAHIVILNEQHKRDEIVQLFAKKGIKVPPEVDFENAGSFRALLLQLVDKLRDEMLKEPAQKVEQMVREDRSREEIKKYLDSVVFTFEGWKSSLKKDKENVLKDVPELASQTLCTLGDYFPKQPPDPIRAVKAIRGQAFAKEFVDEKGRFTKSGIAFYLLQNHFLAAKNE